MSGNGLSGKDFFLSAVAGWAQTLDLEVENVAPPGPIRKWHKARVSPSPNNFDLGENSLAKHSRLVELLNGPIHILAHFKQPSPTNVDFLQSKERTKEQKQHKSLLTGELNEAKRIFGGAPFWSKSPWTSAAISLGKDRPHCESIEIMADHVIEDGTKSLDTRFIQGILGKTKSGELRDLLSITFFTSPNWPTASRIWPTWQGKAQAVSKSLKQETPDIYIYIYWYIYIYKYLSVFHNATGQCKIIHTSSSVISLWSPGCSDCFKSLDAKPETLTWSSNLSTCLHTTAGSASWNIMKQKSNQKKKFLV